MVEEGCCADCLAIESNIDNNSFFDCCREAPYLSVISVDISLKIQRTGFDFILRRCEELKLNANIYTLYCEVFYPDFKFIIFEKQWNSLCDMQHVLIQCHNITYITTNVTEAITAFGKFIKSNLQHTNYLLAVNAVAEIDKLTATADYVESGDGVDLNAVNYMNNVTTPRIPPWFYETSQVSLKYSNSVLYYQTEDCLAGLEPSGRITFIGAKKLSAIKELYRLIVKNVATAKYSNLNKEYRHRVEVVDESESDTGSVVGFCRRYGFCV
jgi:hypothetical protein